MAAIDKEHNLRAETGWLQSTKSTTEGKNWMATIDKEHNLRAELDGYNRQRTQPKG